MRRPAGNVRGVGALQLFEKFGGRHAVQQSARIVFVAQTVKKEYIAALRTQKVQRFVVCDNFFVFAAKPLVYQFCGNVVREVIRHLISPRNSMPKKPYKFSLLA